MTELNALLRQRLLERLAAFEVEPCEDSSLKKAAVAIVVVPGPKNIASFLLTKRSAQLKRHAGQWALPGGRVDEDEDVVTAALRELHEELGLRCDRSDVLGCLDDYPTRSGYAVTPVVVWGDPCGEIALDPNEVAAVYRVPLADLAKEQAVREHRIEQSEKPVLSLRLETLGQEIYAPTAAMLHQFHEVAVCGRNTRVSQFEQPVFAWR